MADHMHHNECVRSHECCEHARIRAAHTKCCRYKSTGCVDCHHCGKQDVSRDVLRKVVGSASGSILSSVLLAPVDVIKVRQQATNMRVAATVRGVLQSDGVRGFWRGTVPGLTMALPASAAYLVLYEALRDEIAAVAKSEGHAATLAPPVAGFGARVVVAALVNPLELVRTNMQAAAQGSAAGGGMVGALRHTVHTGGVRGLYRGLGAAIARDAPFSAVYWSFFEAAKTRAATSGIPLLTRGGDSPVPGPPQPSMLGTLLAAGCGGGVAAVVTNPFDVVKTRIQTGTGGAAAVAAVGGATATLTRARAPSMWRELATVVRSQGVTGLYAGLSLRLARIVPATALFMTTFEVVKRARWDG